MQEWMTTLLGSVDIRFAILLSLLAEIIIAVMGVVPSIFVTTANVAIFGVVEGFMLSTVGEIIGAQITFYLYRYGFRKPIEKHVQNKWVKRLLHDRKEFGFFIVLQGRLIPFIPSGLVTFYAAVSLMNGTHFFIASTIGKLPAMMLEVLAAYGILQMNTIYIGLLLAVLVGVGLWLWFKKKNGEKNDFE